MEIQLEQLHRLCNQQQLKQRQWLLNEEFDVIFHCSHYHRLIFHRQHKIHFDPAEKGVRYFLYSSPQLNEYERTNKKFLEQHDHISFSPLSHSQFLSLFVISITQSVFTLLQKKLVERHLITFGSSRQSFVENMRNMTDHLKKNRCVYDSIIETRLDSRAREENHNIITITVTLLHVSIRS